MDFKPKNREWVKNAAIIFLSVLLVLTFFSNTIMNRSLPEVATQAVTDGSITAKVRGTGTVTANGLHQVKAEQTREIRAVMIKSGQDVNAGDVLFVLGEGDSEELEAAQEKLRQLQLSYQRAAISLPTFNYEADERKLEDAKEKKDAAYKAMKNAGGELEDVKDPTLKADIIKAQENLDGAKKSLDRAIESNEKAKKDALALVAEKQAEYDRLSDRSNVSIESAGGPPATTPPATTPPATTPPATTPPETTPPATTPPETTPPATNPPATEPPEGEGSGGSASGYSFPSEEAYQAALDQARQELSDARTALDLINNTTDPAVQAAQDLYDAYAARLTELEVLAGINNEDYLAKKAAYDAAYEEWISLKEALDEKKTADNKSQQLSYLDLQDLSVQISKAQKELAELSGGAENQILAKVSGTVQSIECTAGDMATDGQVLCSIEVPDMGYTMGFSVTNEQARRLRVGDTASVSNYYWGSEVVATLVSIKTDPKNPMTSKILTFDLSGDVSAGAELTISVGQKSANYDVIIPNSSIRSDTNGSFVLKIEAKNSPLGNRYFARRVNIEVLAADDNNSAVTGDLGYGDYVITTGNAPVANGDMVRLADN